MAAELALDIVKTYSGRVPIRARFRYPVEASTMTEPSGPGMFLP